MPDDWRWKAKVKAGRDVVSLSVSGALEGNRMVQETIDQRNPKTPLAGYKMWLAGYRMWLPGSWEQNEGLDAEGEARR